MSIADKLTKISENVTKVYQAGYYKGASEVDGYDAGYTKGEADGRNAEYDAFWNAIQHSGKRTDYYRAFTGVKWTRDTFKPKYDIVPVNAMDMFNSCFLDWGDPIDFVELLDELGIKFDLSKCTNTNSCIRASNIWHIGVLNLTASSSSTSSLFRETKKLTTVDGLILRDDGTNDFGYSFYNCSSLTEITKIEGVIGNNIEFGQSPVNKGTITRIINALSAETTGKTCKFVKFRVNKEFETAEGLADGSTSAEWLALVATKPNWTISLA